MNRILTFSYLSLAGGLAVAGATLFGAADATAQEVNFKGKRINAIIGSSAGGGTDGTTRLVGRHLEKYLPGKPRIVYRNMPAGHGVQAVNYFNNVVKKDGTAWLGGSSSYVDANNLRKSVVKYDPRKFNYIGGVARGGSVITMRKTKIPNISDKSKPPVIIGAVDGSRSWGQMMLWGKDKLGWNIKFVIGYPGAPSLTLAARRGEVDAFGTSSIGLHETMAKTGDFESFVQLGEVEDGKIVPRISFPKVPVMPELMKGKLSGVGLETFQFWTKTNQIDKWYALPPGTADNVVKTYRAAYAKVVKDPEFIKFGRFQFSKDFAAQTAEDVLDLISSTSYPKAEIFTYIHDMAVRHGLPGEPLSDAEMSKLAKELGGLATAKGTKLDKIQRGGRILHFMDKGKAQKVKVSGSRTKVYIGGKKTKRDKLKPSMVCDISFMPGEATEVNCK
jgi:tripartite-type tricarboxylate transporter receptor subunit TctC